MATAFIIESKNSRGDRLSVCNEPLRDANRAARKPRTRNPWDDEGSALEKPHPLDSARVKRNERKRGWLSCTLATRQPLAQKRLIVTRSVSCRALQLAGEKNRVRK